MLAWYSSKKAAGLGPDLQMFETVISCCVNSKHFEIAGRVFEEMMIGSVSSSTEKLNLKMASLSFSKIRECNDIVPVLKLQGNSRVCGRLAKA
ncbi:hypothetical protein P8452_28396 [Trifolium repens]|nr:hypothetical protein QL285_064749 [Trifolium repens]WJX40976.1 hypothetical protein P8452_28396 [Trifolium repens]